MTVDALVAGGDMSRCFSGRLDTVVAGYATAGYGCVIHKSDYAPVRGDMTIGTFSRRHYMIGWF